MQRQFNVTLIAILLMSFAATQIASGAPAVLRVETAGHSTILSSTDLTAMPQQTLNVVDEKGNHATYEGVPIIEILRRAGVPTGNQIRGKQLALYLLVTASDGYHAVFALPEFDPDFTDRAPENAAADARPRSTQP